MFDVSFGELLLVLIIGLIVLGPARLPTAIKTVVGWINTLRRLSANVQLELNKELKLQELQESLKQAEESGLNMLTPEIQASIDELKRITQSLQQELNQTAQQVSSSKGNQLAKSPTDNQQSDLPQIDESPEVNNQIVENRSDARKHHHGE